ncbi:hypothetical protein DP117_10175 [Brasilonema sp. UFV-L1]|nr:hypothetical protein [Brasilonema sp. UFV-L1]
MGSQCALGGSLRCSTWRVSPSEVTAEPVRVLGSQSVAQRSLSGGFLRSELRRVPPVEGTGVVSPMLAERAVGCDW